MQPDLGTRPSLRRLAIRWVRRPAGAIAVAALAAIPLVVILRSTPEPAPGPPPFGAVPQEPAASPVALIPTSAPPAELPESARKVRAQLAELTQRSTSDLIELLESKTQSERLVAANALWARGQRAQVETVAASTGDRVLLAKVEALKNRVQPQ